VAGRTTIVDKVSTQIRLPAALHRQLREVAHLEDRSLNNLMVRFLTEAVQRYLEERGERERSKR
jgi:hypothetical protein